MVRQANEFAHEDGDQQTFKVQYKRKPVSLLPTPQNIGENQEVCTNTLEGQDVISI